MSNNRKNQLSYNFEVRDNNRHRTIDRLKNLDEAGLRKILKKYEL